MISPSSLKFPADKRDHQQLTLEWRNRNYVDLQFVIGRTRKWRTAVKHYVHLFIMAVLSFIAMYIFMYAMVDRFENVYPNLNQAYMAALMAAPMVMIELVVMRSMYKNRTANIAVFVASILVLALSWFFIRQQTLIGDNQFLTSMIPHHAGAILMCEQASIQDGEIVKLCKEIISSQQREIEQMKGILKRLEAR